RWLEHGTDRAADCRPGYSAAAASGLQHLAALPEQDAEWPDACPGDHRGHVARLLRCDAAGAGSADGYRRHCVPAVTGSTQDRPAHTPLGRLLHDEWLSG